MLWIKSRNCDITDYIIKEDRSPSLKAETHDATCRCDKAPRLHCCCNKSLALILSLQIQTSLNSCDRLQRQ